MRQIRTSGSFPGYVVKVGDVSLHPLWVMRSNVTMASMMGQRRVLSVAAAVSAGALALLIHPPTAPGDSGSWCRQAENKDYPQLEAVAESIVGDVSDRIVRTSECEQKGRPEPGVLVSVYRWTTHRQASEYLRTRGLLPHSGSSGFRSADGAYEIRSVTVTDHLENQGRPYVSLYISADH